MLTTEATTVFAGMGVFVLDVTSLCSLNIRQCRVQMYHEFAAPNCAAKYVQVLSCMKGKDVERLLATIKFTAQPGSLSESQCYSRLQTMGTNLSFDCSRAIQVTHDGLT